MTKIVIVGGTSTIAEACAEMWADSDKELVLVGRNLHKLEVLKNHLLITRSTANVEILEMDFSDPNSVRRKISNISNVDVALIAHGELTNQQLAQSNPDSLTESVMVNATSVAVFLESFLVGMAERNSGTLAVIGSVAGDRGRASNYVYGSSKGFLEKYTQGLRMRFSGTGIKIILFKLGPTKTRMTSGMDQKGFAEPVAIASSMIKILSKGKSGVFYIPKKWRVIMSVVKLLPTALLAKLNL